MFFKVKIFVWWIDIYNVFIYEFFIINHGVGFIGVAYAVWWRYLKYEDFIALINTIVFIVPKSFLCSFLGLIYETYMYDNDKNITSKIYVYLYLLEPSHAKFVF